MKGNHFGEFQDKAGNQPPGNKTGRETVRKVPSTLNKLTRNLGNPSQNQNLRFEYLKTQPNQMISDFNTPNWTKEMNMYIWKVKTRCIRYENYAFHVPLYWKSLAKGFLLVHPPIWKKKCRARRKSTWDSFSLETCNIPLGESYQLGSG